MRSPQAKIAIITVILVAVTLGVLILAMMQQAEVSCEVCVTFQGQTDCKVALGPDRESAIRTATDNACGLLARGMADGISCQNTTPDSITCSDGP
jgi:hypothetical protein